MDVAFLAIGVDPRLRCSQRLFRVGDRGQRLVVDFDQVERLLGRPLVPRDHRGDGIAHVPHLLAAQRLLVLADRQDAELAADVAPGEHEVDARRRFGLAGVDATDPRMGVWRSQELAVQHARKFDVIGKDRTTRDFGSPVHPAARGPDDGESVLGVHAPTPLSPASSSGPIAASIDSKICW